MQPSFSVSITQGDARTFSYSALVGGIVRDLTGYTVVLTAVSTSPTGTTTTITASAAGGSTGATVELPTAQTGVAGLYRAVITATKNGSPGPWSAAGTIEIVARPA